MGLKAVMIYPRGVKIIPIILAQINQLSGVNLLNSKMEYRLSLFAYKFYQKFVMLIPFLIFQP
ncbi:hypothetical protein AAX05_09980 [Moraxella bovoculi]|uniref:Uncharacterized protein n=1 Tax=Moraxella bovoculi TaxID=386891 RepID=A0AAC8PXJ1_9GAMM|nr:hypothetical protein AAX06_10975 [Moraxella bovoculi]AKG10403.1 hypothetical protein AAX05_09980 [Moraxella bovoculi]AKG12428.1 hypothetical protein AAX07_11225 [Moraxella bovoculi]AKG14389.1 hypothetical protein AAX11_10665 [Moraxella bovoculi]